MNEIKKRSQKGTKIIGICNGFQILTESKLLPGSLLQNENLKFICKKIFLKVKNNNTFFSKKYKLNEIINVPIAHMEGRYYCSKKTLKELENNKQIIFQYCSNNGNIKDTDNPNGSTRNIAGIINLKGNVLGMMPHPERCSEELLGGENGINFFKSIFESIN
jgi:phosphoribosylformylglycinamidine synthase